MRRPRWRIWRAKSWYLADGPWIVECPSLPGITADPTGHLSFAHQKACVDCDRFTSFDSARRHVADRIGASKP